MTIKNYWSQFIIIPGIILKEIVRICRSFLWKSKEEMQGAGAVAWGHLCRPKNVGGLGFQNLEIWNRAECMKHIWDVDKKKDNLWLRWVHHIYLRGKDV